MLSLRIKRGTQTLQFRGMLSFAWKNLISRPVRSLLALCGLTVAIAGMVGLFSVAEGIEDTVSTTFGKVPGLTVMQPGAPIPLFSRLPAAWGDEIRAVEGVHVVHPEVWSRAHVIDGKPTISPPRFLFGSDLEQARKLRYSVYREGIREGRVLTPEDRGTRRIMISRAIADEFHKGIGESLRIDGRDCEIVGIYQAQSLFLDVAIILDIEEVRRLARVGADSVSNFYVEPDPAADRSLLADQLKELFRGRAPEAWQPAQALATELADQPVAAALAGLAQSIGQSQPQPTVTPGDSEPRDGEKSPASAEGELPVEIRSPEDWAGAFRRFSEDLDLFLLLMTSIGITIAFVGIVNTMLMSVTERFIEFGILKANGWTNGEVLRLIACESALLGLAGGLTGSVLGWIATLLINARWPDRIHLYASPQLLLFSLGFSTVLGVAGGLYPALRAARMLPMDAIRRG
ncbi:MAG: ABC transporter permease [Planctomycetales bacterium]